jgi:hypothetical protein
MSLAFFLTIFTRELHEGDPEYIVTIYSTSTGTTTRHKHLFQVHTQHYIEALECNRWPIYILALKEAIKGGWTLEGILQVLKDPTKIISSLAPPPLIVELVTHSQDLWDLGTRYYLLSHWMRCIVSL